MEKKAKKESVHAIERGIDILQVFTYEDMELSLARICEAVGYPKTTVYRILGTLENRNFVVQDSQTGKYRLGYEPIRLGAIARDSNPISRLAQSEMERVSHVTQQTCNLYIRDGYERICINQVAGSQYVQRHSFLGARFPLYCGAGKLILAYAGRDFQRRYFETVSFEPFTDKTPTRAQLQRDLEEILRCGYSVSRGERDPATAMVSIPLFDYTQRVVASITASGPLFFFTDEYVSTYVQALKEASAKISAQMGFQSHKPILID